MRTFLTALMLMFYAVPAWAFVCTDRPVLVTPTVCNVPVGGGTCSFSPGVDGVVDFPNGAVVTGTVTVQGGRNIWVGGDLDDGEAGVGGHILYDPPVGSVGERQGLSFKDGSGTSGLRYMEGLIIDVNGNCDSISVQNHNTNDVTILLVNNYVTGEDYNIIDGNCHGDTIQAQTGGSTVDVNLIVENFAALQTAQGIFIPDQGGSGDWTASFTNVFLRNGLIPDTGLPNEKPQFWVSSNPPASHQTDPYPVSLENMYIATQWSITSKIFPENAIDTAGVITWPPEELITGFLTHGTEPNNIDLSFPENLGLNYDRDFFCGVVSLPHTHSEYLLRADMWLWCRKNGFNSARCAEFEN